MIRGEEKRMQKEEERTARMNVLITIILFPETYPEHKTPMFGEELLHYV